MLTQHADVISANGTLIVFGADQGTNGNGFGMDGTVYASKLFQVHRTYYVDFYSAKKYKIKSAVLIITPTESEAFTQVGISRFTFHHIYYGKIQCNVAF